MEGDNLAGWDLAVTSATVSPDPAISPSSLRAEVSVSNFGIADIQGFTLSCSAPGVGEYTAHFDTPLPSAQSAIVRFSFDPGMATDSSTEWTLSVAGLDGGEDEREVNNSVGAEYTFLRNVLLEEFTTEKCSNCPAAATMLHQMFAEPLYEERVAMVAHHSGFYTDAWTSDADQAYLWFYNDGDACYAPALMLDRRPVKSNTPVFNAPSMASDMMARLDQAMAVKANAVIGLSARKEGANIVVTVNGMHNANYSSTNPRLTLWLTENDVPAVAQSAGGAGYRHMHLTRAYNSTWGAPVEWTPEGTFTYEYGFTLDEAWNPDNMHIVAALSNYDPESPVNCLVDNAASVSLPVALPVETVMSDADAADEWYTLEGIRVNASTVHSGVYLHRTGESVTKVVVP